ncbi:MAG: hypothetical protein R2729_23065 [Bryobacteraceae bacterium]
MKAVSAVVLLLALPSASKAYYDDMHYQFTYFLARAVGYTPLQAYRVASATVSIDHDTDTEPVRSGPQAVSVAERTSRVGRSPNDPGSATRSAELPRIQLHAFMDCLHNRDCLADNIARARAQAVIPRYRERLWRQGLQSGNPGPFFHFSQDELPHRGYPSDGGHWASPTAAHRYDLVMGATTDYLDFEKPERNRPMIEESLRRLRQYLTILNPRQRFFAVDFLDRNVQGAYAALRKANRVTQAPPFTDALAQAMKDFERNPTLTTTLLRTIYLWKLASEPSDDRASKAIDGQLTVMNATDRIPKYKQYELTSSGNPERAEVDDWVLHGDLRVVVAPRGGLPGDALPASVKVQVLAVPTFRASWDQEYVLAEADSNGQAVEFRAIPVGAVKVQAVFATGPAVVRTFTVDKQKQEITLQVDTGGAEWDDLLSKLRDLERQSNATANELAKKVAALEQRWKQIEEAARTASQYVQDRLAGTAGRWGPRWGELAWASENAQAAAASLTRAEKLAAGIAEGIDGYRRTACEGRPATGRVYTSLAQAQGAIRTLEADVRQAASLVERLQRAQRLFGPMNTWLERVRQSFDFLIELETRDSALAMEFNEATRLAAALIEYRRQAAGLHDQIEVQATSVLNNRSRSVLHPRARDVLSLSNRSYGAIRANAEAYQQLRAQLAERSKRTRATVSAGGASLLSLSGRVPSALPAVDSRLAGEVANKPARLANLVARLRTEEQSLSGCAGLWRLTGGVVVNPERQQTREARRFSASHHWEKVGTIAPGRITERRNLVHSNRVVFDLMFDVRFLPANLPATLRAGDSITIKMGGVARKLGGWRNRHADVLDCVTRGYGISGFTRMSLAFQGNNGVPVERATVFQVTASTPAEFRIRVGCGSLGSTAEWVYRR